MLGDSIRGELSFFSSKVTASGSGNLPSTQLAKGLDYYRALSVINIGPIVSWREDSSDDVRNERFKKVSFRHMRH